METLFHQHFHYSQPELKFMDVNRMTQNIDETTSQFLDRFKVACMRYSARILKKELVEVTMMGTRNFKTIKQFNGKCFRDLRN